MNVTDRHAVISGLHSVILSHTHAVGSSSNGNLPPHCPLSGYLYNRSHQLITRHLLYQWQEAIDDNAGIRIIFIRHILYMLIRAGQTVQFQSDILVINRIFFHPPQTPDLAEAAYDAFQTGAVLYWDREQLSPNFGLASKCDMKHGLTNSKHRHIGAKERCGLQTPKCVSAEPLPRTSLGELIRRFLSQLVRGHPPHIPNPTRQINWWGGGIDPKYFSKIPCARTP